MAAGIPLGAICDLLGVPDGDRVEVLRLTSSALGSHDADSTAADAWIAKSEILLSFANLARERRAGGHADVIALLAASRVNGLPLDDDEIMLNCYSLILGGDGTARLSMVGAALALADHPDQWQALKRGDTGIDTAVEEMLRWTTPALHSGRTATTDTEVGGWPVGAGDVVTVWNASANRDERVFDEPDRLRLDRTPDKHVTFAYGPTSASAPTWPGPRSGPSWRGCARRWRSWSGRADAAGLLELPQRPQLTAAGTEGGPTQGERQGKDRGVSVRRGLARLGSEACVSPSPPTWTNPSPAPSSSTCGPGATRCVRTGRCGTATTRSGRCARRPPPVR
ncbi:cytochrome P450 [Streptomyces sp. NPDC048751]|uniref:cytochrome P450 n=1 Tax=Streptomyces sp. NPDC048751 TaxID=3365591 RepID=UPI003713D91A